MPVFRDVTDAGENTSNATHSGKNGRTPQTHVDWLEWLDPAQLESLGRFWLAHTQSAPSPITDRATTGQIAPGTDARTLRPLEESTPYWLLGRVCGDLGMEYRVRLSRETRLARFTGTFTSDERPTIGDFVLVAESGVKAARSAEISNPPREQSEACLPIFSHVLPRSNRITRTLPYRRSPQPLASNVTHVMLVVGSDDNRHLLLAEQVLQVAEAAALPALALVTKTDVGSSDYWKTHLPRLGFAQVLEGVNSPEGRKALLQAVLQPRTSLLLIGPSGAGKSTLTNQLIGREERATSSVGRRGLGRHQSTTREGFLVAGAHFIIDSPGVRTLAS